jgi:hypothetical protein
MERLEVAERYGLPPAEEFVAMKAEIKRLSGLVENALAILKRLGKRSENLPR